MKTTRKETNVPSRRDQQFLPTGKAGFTLIELLVVIAIISLLVSILLPSLGKAKDLAKAAMGAAQTRNMALAFLIYREDWDFLPWGCSGLATADPQYVGEGGLYALRASIADELELKHGIDTVKAYTCPANPGESRRWWASGDGPPSPRLAGAFMADNYCFYTYLDGKDLPDTMRATYPDEVADGAYVASHNNLSSDRALLGCRAFSITNPVGGSPVAYYNEHFNNTTYKGFNAAYGDAHVEWTDMPDDFDQPSPTSASFISWQTWSYWWK